MKKLKVLLVAYNNLGKGGIQNQLVGLIRSLRHKVDFDIVVWDDVKDYYTEELVHYGVKIIRCFRDIGKNRLRQKADVFIRYNDLRKLISDVIKENGPYDVMHCNNAYDAAPCLEAAYRANIPVRISHAHNMENPSLKKKLAYPAYKILYAYNRQRIRQYATQMIGCSKQVVDYFFGYNQGKVIHIGIDLSEFQDTKTTEKNNKSFEILHVGSMSEQKNQLFLVQIMEKLIKDNHQVHLTMIGGGTTYLEKVKNQIASTGTKDYISILSPDSTVSKAMKKADLFVFPSTFEGFGIVLIEAQAMGLRCLVSDIVSTEVDCGGVKYLPLEKGPSYWVKTIQEEMEKKDIERNIYDVSEFSVENMSEKIYKLYTN